MEDTQAKEPAGQTSPTRGTGSRPKPVELHVKTIEKFESQRCSPPQPAGRQSGGNGCPGAIGGDETDVQTSRNRAGVNAQHCRTSVSKMEQASKTNGNSPRPDWRDASRPEGEASRQPQPGTAEVSQELTRRDPEGQTYGQHMDAGEHRGANDSKHNMCKWGGLPEPAQQRSGVLGRSRQGGGAQVGVGHPRHDIPAGVQEAHRNASSIREMLASIPADITVSLADMV